MFRFIRRVLSDVFWPTILLLVMGFFFTCIWSRGFSNSFAPQGSVSEYRRAELLSLVWPYCFAAIISYQLSWRSGTPTKSSHQVPFGIFLVNLLLFLGGIILLFVGPVWL